MFATKAGAGRSFVADRIPVSIVVHSPYPQHIRELAGIRPHSEVEFYFEDGKVWLIRAEADTRSRSSRGQLLVERLRGTATANLDLTTDEIMAMTRGED